MRLSKGMLIAVGLLVVGAIAVMLSENMSQNKSDSKIGSSIADNQLLMGVDKITLKSASNEVSLTRKDEGAWQLADGFPVDAGRIDNLFKTLKKTNYQREAGSRSDFKNLAISEEKFLKLKGAKELQILLGKNRSGGGQYVALAGEDKAYLISQALDLNADASSWELKKLVSIEAKKIKHVSFFAGKRKYDVEREKAEDDLKIKQKTKLKAKDYQIKQLANVMENISFVERYDPSNELAKTALASAKIVDVDLFDGRSYQIKLGKVKKKDSEKYFINIEKTKPGKDIDKEAVARDELLSKMMGSSVFEVQAFTYNKLVKDENDVFEKKVSQKKKDSKKG